MDPAHKIYAKVIENRLREKAEKLKIFPEMQARFRKKRGCIDNIYALKIAAEKTLSKKKGKLYTFFADFIE